MGAARVRSRGTGPRARRARSARLRARPAEGRGCPAHFRTAPRRGAGPTPFMHGSVQRWRTRQCFRSLCAWR